MVLDVLCVLLYNFCFDLYILMGISESYQLYAGILVYAIRERRAVKGVTAFQMFTDIVLLTG